jgi:hypothetical protein
MLLDLAEPNPESVQKHSDLLIMPFGQHNLQLNQNDLLQPYVLWKVALEFGRFAKLGGQLLFFLFQDFQ